MAQLNDEDKLKLIKEAVKSYPDFPVAGVLFRDLFSVLQNPPLFALLKELLTKKAQEIAPAVQSVVGLDARGFLLGPLIALELQIPFVPIRKKGKLPGKVRSLKYALEYGEDTVEIQEGAIRPGERVLIVDDLLATGGTLNAACQLVEQVGGQVVRSMIVIELVGLKGRAKLPVEVTSLIQF
ncbi:adenine phosphoribosyltransferase [Dendroctonus ponderosae]